jgi:hypothetical protein
MFVPEGNRVYTIFLCTLRYIDEPNDVKVKAIGKHLSSLYIEIIK